MNLAIIDYGAGNVFSVKSAFERLGIAPLITSNHDEIKSADFVVFPGVGHAQNAMKQLAKKQLDELIPNLVQPTLGICLGMQLMCNSSEEGNTKGLGIFNDVNVEEFKIDLNIPHMGWNDLESTKGFMENISEPVYFVHSYYVPNSKYTVANCNYKINFSAALEKNNFYACQFHPEKSGKVGETILKQFLKTRK